MNEIQLDSSLFIDISSLQNLFDILQRPNLMNSFIFANPVLFDCEMGWLLDFIRWQEYDFVVHDSEMTIADRESIDDPHFFEFHDY